MSVAILISLIFALAIAIGIVQFASFEKRQQKKEYEDIKLKSKPNIIPVYSMDKLIENSKKRPFYNIKHGGFYASGGWPSLYDNCGKYTKHGECIYPCLCSTPFECNSEECPEFSKCFYREIYD